MDARPQRHLAAGSEQDHAVLGVVNFPPRQIGPVRSEVLVLGATDAEDRVILLGPGSEVPLGARIH